MNVLTFFIVGVCNGIGVIISEYFGGKDEKRLKLEMGTATGFGGMVFGLLSMLLWILGAITVLRIIRTPKEVAGPDWKLSPRHCSWPAILSICNNLYCNGPAQYGNMQKRRYIF